MIDTKMLRRLGVGDHLNSTTVTAIRSLCDQAEAFENAKPFLLCVCSESPCVLQKIEDASHQPTPIQKSFSKLRPETQIKLLVAFSPLLKEERMHPWAEIQDAVFLKDKSPYIYGEFFNTNHGTAWKVPKQLVKEVLEQLS